jgi:hypothetical protein
MTLRLYLTGLKVEYNEKLDEYWIYNTDGKFRFRLGKPYLVDPKDMNPLCDEFGLPYQNAVKHSLTEVSKGEYLYVKETGKGFANVKLPKSFLIDADTVYSSTADGLVGNSGSSVWSTVHDAGTGNSTATNSTSYANGSSCFYVNMAGLYNFIIRLYFYYSLTGLSGTVTAVTENIYGVTNGQSSVSIQKGTQQDTLAVEDFDSFTGNEYGHTSSWSTSGYNSITYNAQGISDVNGLIGSGVHKSCAREYPHDYQNSTAGTTSYKNGNYFADTTDTTYDPYLYVTLTAGGSLPLKNVFNRPFSGVFR